MPYSYKPKKKKKNIAGKLIIGTAILFILATIAISVILVNKNVKNINDKKNLDTLYKTLFNDKNYLELIKQMDMALKKNPFKMEYLVYRGYSYFLLGEDESDKSIRMKYFSSALFDLRQALAVGVSEDNKANIYFSIGKIYFYYGNNYYRQALMYLEKSRGLGNSRKDLLYTIGVIYSHTGKYKKAAEIFIHALAEEESDILLLAIANSFFLASDYENAKNYIDKVVKKSYDPKIKEKGYLLLGEILYNEEQYEDALVKFDKVIELNTNNASAYFFKGEIYYKFNEVIKARSEWRKTLEIDPSHIKARKRIY